MPSDIVILHRRKASSASRNIDRSVFPCAEKDSQWIKWETCLREVYFGSLGSLSASNVPDDIEIYRGAEAYRFCLNITCGLNSPIVGETEVWGQFRTLFKEFDYASCAFGGELRVFIEALFADAKRIRHLHLSGLGSQSYGSLARRHFKNIEEVNILGSGALVKDMLPWLVKRAKVLRLICRRPEKGLERVAELNSPNGSSDLRSQVEVVALGDCQGLALAGGLLVAAPMASSKIAQHLNYQQVQKLIDLRDLSSTDPLPFSGVVSLQDFFSEIETTKGVLEQKVCSARSEIEDLVQLRFEELRAFQPQQALAWG